MSMEDESARLFFDSELQNRIYLYPDKIGFVEYVQSMGDDLTIVNSARVSFSKHKTGPLDNADRNLIKYLIKNKHTSTLEHNMLTVRVKVPLFVRSQHQRHRTFSYNEKSYRYTSDDLEFFVPSQYRKQSESNKQCSNGTLDLDMNSEFVRLTKLIHSDALNLYELMIVAGVAREQARGVLPQNLYTEYYATANLNNWLKFLGLRDHLHAQEEIRVLAKGCRMILECKFPETMKLLKEIEQP